MRGVWWGGGGEGERVFEGFCGLGVFERVLWFVCLFGGGSGFCGGGGRRGGIGVDEVGGKVREGW